MQVPFDLFENSKDMNLLKYKLTLDKILFKLYNNIEYTQKGDVLVKKNIGMILMLVILSIALVGCGGSKLADGTYPGEGTGMEPMKVSVEVKDGKIASVDITEHAESEGYCEAALEQIPQVIVEKNSTDVDAVSGATVTSEGIKEAVNNALESAK